MSSRRYRVYRFKFEGGPFPYAAVVFANGYVLEPEGRFYSFPYSAKTWFPLVFYAGRDKFRGPLMIESGSGFEILDYDFAQGSVLGSVFAFSASDNVMVGRYSGGYVLEQYRGAGGVCSSFAGRYFINSASQTLGWSLAANRPNFRAFALLHDGTFALGAETSSGTNCVINRGALPPSCQVNHWDFPSSYGRLVGLAFVGQRRFFCSNTNGVFDWTDTANVFNVWGATRDYFFASRGYLWNIKAADLRTLVGFDLVSGQAFEYKTYNAVPKYIVVWES